MKIHCYLMIAAIAFAGICGAEMTEDEAYQDFYKKVEADEPYIGFFAAEKACIGEITDEYKAARRAFFLGVRTCEEDPEEFIEPFTEFCKDEGLLKDGSEEEWNKRLTILSYVLYGNTGVFEYSADNLTEHRNLVFAEYPNKKLMLDLFLPENAIDEPIPCIVAIHGGGWRVNTRVWFEPFAQYLANKGFAAVTIDYRMLPAVGILECVYDTKAAVRWVRANADMYGIDPDRIGAIGASAGAQLIALLASSADVPELEGTGGNAGVSTEIHAAVGFATPAFKMDDERAARMARRFGLSEEHMRLISPYENISEDSAPLYLVHGTTDRVVNPEDSQAIYDRYKEVGASVELTWIPDQGHGFYEGSDLGIKHAADYFIKQFSPESD
jgi:acetyl esterase/lipase